MFWQEIFLTRPGTSLAAPYATKRQNKVVLMLTTVIGLVIFTARNHFSAPILYRSHGLEH